jgi:spermidine/putrescine-binding protein
VKRSLSFFVFLAVLIVPVINSCDMGSRLTIYNWTYYTPDTVIRKVDLFMLVYELLKNNHHRFFHIQNYISYKYLWKNWSTQIWYWIWVPRLIFTMTPGLTQ